MNHYEAVCLLIDEERRRSQWLQTMRNVESEIFASGNIELMKLHRAVKNELLRLDKEDVREEDLQISREPCEIDVSAKFIELIITAEKVAVEASQNTLVGSSSFFIFFRKKIMLFEFFKNILFFVIRMNLTNYAMQRRLQLKKKKGSNKLLP